MNKLGTIADLYGAPLFQSLKEKPEMVNLITDSELHISKMLREEELDAAFLSPITFARDHDIYSIVPDVCILLSSFPLFHTNSMRKQKTD